MTRGLLLTAGALAALLLATAPASAQQGAAGGEWTSYGGDVGHTRYAPLSQIDAGNFSTLQVAWRFKVDNLGPRPETQFQATPLVKDGVMYTTGGSRRAVTALDARTGEQLWVYSRNEGQRAANAPRQLSGRGVAWWGDGREQRILYVTPGYRLIALDARTGRPVESFGDKGVIDLKQDFDQDVGDLDTADVGLHATPTIAGGVVVVGAAHGSGANPAKRSAVKGYVRGFDVRTGKRLWTFHTIPRKGEFGYDTWAPGTAELSGNTGVWAQISADENLGLAYLPVEMPTGDYYGGSHPGANLYSDSLVAVDLRTGERRWHYQLVHHDIWDYDIPSPPILLDVRKDGKLVKAIAQPTKQGLLYVLDRETGKPVWPIPEVKVEKGNAPGEWYSPTQPMPGPAFRYMRQGMARDFLIDFTPQLRAQAEAQMSAYKIGPLFTPQVVSEPDGLLGTLKVTGGSNWQGGSVDAETGVVYVTASQGLSTTGLVRQPGYDMPYGRGDGRRPFRMPSAIRSDTQLSNAPEAEAPNAATTAAMQRGGLTVQGLPMLKPPYGTISAIDVGQGKMLWTVPNGETPANITNHPALKAMNLARTGRVGETATLTTRTLVIVAEPGLGPTPDGRRGSMLRAYDKLTGKEVGAVYLPAPVIGSPMTYSLDGQQYLAMTIGGGGLTGEVHVLKLPR